MLFDPIHMNKETAFQKGRIVQCRLAYLQCLISTKSNTRYLKQFIFNLCHSSQKVKKCVVFIIAVTNDNFKKLVIYLRDFLSAQRAFFRVLGSVLLGCAVAVLTRLSSISSSMSVVLSHGVVQPHLSSIITELGRLREPPEKYQKTHSIILNMVMQSVN